MSENDTSKKDIKALIEELRPFFIGLGLGLALLVVFILLCLAVGLWPALVPPGYDFAQPR